MTGLRSSADRLEFQASPDAGLELAELLGFTEEFGFEAPDDELVSEFTSVDGIMRVVWRLSSA